jgi:hypothetical protein
MAMAAKGQVGADFASGSYPVCLLKILFGLSRPMTSGGLPRLLVVLRFLAAQLRSPFQIVGRLRSWCAVPALAGDPAAPFGAVLVAARLDRITRRAHTLSQLLEDGVPTRTADMPGADDLMMRVYAAMAQKERELISERTRAALAAARARRVVLGGDRGYRPSAALTPVWWPRRGVWARTGLRTGCCWRWRRCGARASPRTRRSRGR